MAKIVDLQHRWAHEIGRVFVAFGGMEHCVHLLLQTLPADPIHRTTVDTPLSLKAKLLLEILESRTGPEEEAIVPLLKSLVRLAKERNLIAHNPLVLDFYVDADRNMAVGEVIQSLRPAGQHMTFEELVKLREESEKITSELYGAVTAFWRTARAKSLSVPKRKK